MSDDVRRKAAFGQLDCIDFAEKTITIKSAMILPPMAAGTYAIVPLKDFDLLVRAASVDGRPKAGDALAAPLATSAVTAKPADAQTPSPSPPESN